MAKRKDKPQVINNIQELNLEIDYDKLAEAIVKAQKQTNVETDIKNQKNKHAFLKNIYCFIFNKAEQKNNVLVDFFKLPIVGLFRLISITCCVLFPFIIKFSCDGLRSIEYSLSTFWDWAIFAELYVLLPLFTIAMGISTWGAANQFSRETDKNFVLTLFSGIISLAALIVAVMSLLVG